MRRTRPTLALMAGLAVPALLVAPTPASAAKKPIRLAGGAAASGALCNANVAFQQTPLASAAQAVIAAPKTKKGRSSRKGTKVLVERCANGAWTTVTRASIGARKSARRLRLATAQASTGDYRVRIIDRRNKTKGRAVYFRVGVGEIVDTPVTFVARNQNRTSLPCLNAPDNGLYQIKGTVTGPRTALAGAGSTGKGPDVALYLHGLGYGGFYWRYQGAPGYDYAANQTLNGHVSVVVDRLGYKSSRGPDDGNKVCYQSQADIADQIITSLRSGQYSSGDGRPVKAARVALVGHSAGSLVSLTTQAAFKSADALGVTGFHDAPAALAFTQLGLASAGCITDPQAGPAGTRNYGRFGISDKDFSDAHFFNVDPSVASDVLTQRSLDPCGDLTQAITTFAGSPLFQRSIDVPTLIASGDHDALFPRGGNRLQSSPLLSKPELVTAHLLPDAGHALTLSRTRDKNLQLMDLWLKANRF